MSPREHPPGGFFMAAAAAFGQPFPLSGVSGFLGGVLHWRGGGPKMPGSFVGTDEVTMPRVCYFTGKKTSFGNQITHRGKAKYLGGVGTKITGITRRKFKPNIQKVRAVVDGKIVRVMVSTKAIRDGMISKPYKRVYKPEEKKAET